MNLVICALLTAQVCAQEPDEIARQIGIEMLRHPMIEHIAEHKRSIDWTPPGYLMVGYIVRAA
jgi:hypothetical protein